MEECGHLNICKNLYVFLKVINMLLTEAGVLQHKQREPRMFKSHLGMTVCSEYSNSLRQEG